MVFFLGGAMKLTKHNVKKMKPEKVNETRDSGIEKGNRSLVEWPIMYWLVTLDPNDEY